MKRVITIVLALVCVNVSAQQMSGLKGKTLCLGIDIL